MWAMQENYWCYRCLWMQQKHEQNKNKKNPIAKVPYCLCLEVNVERVPWCCNIYLQAKTHEKVDALGENRAIACEAVALLLHDSVWRYMTAYCSLSLCLTLRSKRQTKTTFCQHRYSLLWVGFICNIVLTLETSNYKAMTIQMVLCIDIHTSIMSIDESLCAKLENESKIWGPIVKQTFSLPKSWMLLSVIAKRPCALFQMRWCLPIGSSLCSFMNQQRQCMK